MIPRTTQKTGLPGSHSWADGLSEAASRNGGLRTYCFSGNPGGRKPSGRIYPLGPVGSVYGLQDFQEPIKTFKFLFKPGEKRTFSLN